MGKGKGLRGWVRGQWPRGLGASPSCSRPCSSAGARRRGEWGSTWRPGCRGAASGSNPASHAPSGPAAGTSPSSGGPWGAGERGAALSPGAGQGGASGGGGYPPPCARSHSPGRPRCGEPRPWQGLGWGCRLSPPSLPPAGSWAVTPLASPSVGAKGPRDRGGCVGTPTPRCLPEGKALGQSHQAEEQEKLHGGC